MIEKTMQTLKTQQPRESQLPAVHAGFFDLQGFELIQRVSKAFATSDLVPKQYQGNLANCMIAMDMAQRIGANPLMVMQNLYVVHGTPGWSSKFLIATINVSGRFSALRYEWKGEPGSNDYGCRAWAIERATNERLDGIWVTWATVKAEGWSNKNGSKWNTMPDQMFIYRAAAFWQRAYAPELGMGLQTAEELGDVFEASSDGQGNFTVSTESLGDVSGVQSRQQTSAKPEQQPIDVDPVVETKADTETETASNETAEDNGPSLDEVMGLVNRGEFDEARDLARSLSDEDAGQVEQAIKAAIGSKRERRPSLE